MPRLTDGRKSEARRFRKLETASLNQKRRQAQRDVATASSRGEIPLEQLRLDCGTQSRAGIDEDAVDRYAEAIREGVRFPAIEVFYDGEKYMLADGFHRVAAALRVGRVTFPVNIHQGTVREAILYSVCANGTHGLPRTRSDIDRAIIRLLRDAEWSAWSDREIARRVGVSHVTVGKKRASLVNVTSEAVLTERTYNNRYGATATMQTAKIGTQGRTNERSSAPQPIVKPRLPEDMPIELVRAVDAGQLATMTAIHMADTLRRVPAEVRDLALRLPLDGPERINILAHLYKSRELEGSNATFDEIALKGGFHYGDDMKKHIDFVSAPLRSVYEALKSVARNHARNAAAEQHEDRLAAAQTPAPVGRHRCIVIDPPWPMEKVLREDRPAQGRYLDYPTMTLEQIESLPIQDLADEDGCHLYLWCPQRFVPAALELVDGWGFGYQCLMTWVKPVGMTPWSWMYNTEHVIFARRGNLPLIKMGEKLSFEAPAKGHSVKPDIFYQRVALVSPGPRLDMFARQPREGFVSWGHEAPISGSEVIHAS